MSDNDDVPLSLEERLDAVFTEMLNSIEPPPSEYSDVVDDNFWDLVDVSNNMNDAVTKSQVTESRGKSDKINNVISITEYKEKKWKNK